MIDHEFQRCVCVCVCGCGCGGGGGGGSTSGGYLQIIAMTGWL